MKKYYYLLLAMFSLAPGLATQKVTTSFIIASTLVLSSTHSKCHYDKNLSLDLHKAIERGDGTLVEKLIKQPEVDVNAKVDYYDGVDKVSRVSGWTPLIWCCWHGAKSLAIVKTLLRHGAIKVNLQNTYGNTPLIACCWKGDQSLVIAKMLLRRKDIKVNLRNRYGDTALAKCCDRGDRSLAIARLLLGRDDIKVNLGDKDGDTPLITCCIVGDRSLKIVSALVKHKDIKVNLGDKNGDTPLIWCCRQGCQSLEIAKCLLDHDDIDVNLKGKKGNTPLDVIVEGVLGNRKEYEYVSLWNVLVAKGATLAKHKTTYQQLNPSSFSLINKVYVGLIKANPPKNYKDRGFVNDERESKEDRPLLDCS